MAAWDQDLEPAGAKPGARPAWEKDLDPPAAVKAGRGLMEIPRQVGLTARYGLEGLGQMAEIATEPVRQIITDPLLRLVTGEGQPTVSTLVTGQPPKPRSKSMGQIATGVADWVGLLSPE